ncbi:hypothetical protein HK405_015006 [Cladochytrium tenue]|nr:hypothetical protein HK405_015006 [Cladochytrium tenue]
MDAVLECEWPLDEGMYNLIRLSIAGKASYTCRLPMSKEASMFWPLTFSFWGVAEDDHTHVMVHWNFVFHALDGFFLGGSVYPLRDHWFTAEMGTPMLIHGPVSSMMEEWMTEMILQVSGENDDDQNDDSADEGPEAQMEDSGSTPKKLKEPPVPPPRPGIAPKSPIRPLTKEELPSMTKILTAVSPRMVMAYVLLSIGITSALLGLLYVAYLKPKLLEIKKKK